MHIELCEVRVPAFPANANEAAPKKIAADNIETTPARIFYPSSKASKSVCGQFSFPAMRLNIKFGVCTSFNF
jgi:hypothetical protein